MKKIRWFKLKGYEAKYAISRCGQFKSIKTGNVLYQYHEFSTGYLSVTLFKSSSNCVRKRVHRLVALQFITNRKSYRCVNHKDGNKLNNNVTNLEWCTHYYNQIHYRDNKNLFKPQKRPKHLKTTVKRKKPRPVLKISINGKILCEYPSLFAAGKAVGVNSDHIRRVASNKFKRKTARGYRWKFKSV